MKKIKKKNKIIYNIFGYLLLIISIVFFLFLLFLNVLTFKWLFLVLVITIFLVSIFDFLLLHPLVKEKIKKIAMVFVLFLIVIYGSISYYLFNTLNFLNIISSDEFITKNYSVIINDSSSITSLDDLKDLKVGYYSLDKLYNEKINVSIDYDLYDDLFLMYNDLMSGKINGILLEGSSLQMLEENKEDFKYKTRQLYSFEVLEKQKIEAKDVNTIKEPFSIYVSGIDTYGSISSISRSDVNMVITVNPLTKTILLTSIPRDYYVNLNGINEKDKLTHAGLYGVDTSIKTIEDLLDININYYLKVNFTSLVDLVNILGGITINSPCEFTAWDGTYFSEGENEVDGEKALSFSRERKSFADGDKQRGKNQQEVIRSIISKASSPSIIMKYNSIISSIGPKIKTNMPQDDITSLIKMQLRDNSKWNVISNSLDGFDGYEYTYSYNGYELYVMIPDEESIKEVHDKIVEVNNGR